jgi:hypothetical protein
MKNRRNRKAARKDQGLLVSVAKSIGSTLGSVVAKAEGLSKPSGRPRKSKKPRATGSPAVKARKKSMA